MKENYEHELELYYEAEHELEIHYSNLIKSIRELKKEKELSSTKLASLINVSPTSLSDFLYFRKKIRIGRVETILHVLEEYTEPKNLA